jgi:hypothetical protein
MCSDHRRTILPAIQPVRRRVRRERVAFTDAPLRLAGLRRWSQVSGVGFDPSQGQVAAGAVGRRRGTGSPAAALGGGGAAWCGFSPPHAAVGVLLKDSMPKTGCWREEDGGGATLQAGGEQGHPELDSRRA